MKGIVIDPRGRVSRSWFLWDLILPNILAGIAIVVIASMNFGTVGDLAVGAIAALLIWSANFAAPMGRLHDIGLPGWIHLIVVSVVFALTTIGPARGVDEVAMRLGDWWGVLMGSSSAVPPVAESSRKLGALIGLGELGLLVFAAGQKGDNRFGPNPKTKGKA